MNSGGKWAVEKAFHFLYSISDCFTSHSKDFRYLSKYTHLSRLKTSLITSLVLVTSPVPLFCLFVFVNFKPKIENFSTSVAIYHYCALPEDKWILVCLLNNLTQSRILVALLLPQEKN